jgi:hypothetical protein
MNHSQVIKEAYEKASEWLEMSENPSTIVEGILASKIVELTARCEYLEKRLDFLSVRSTCKF